MGKTIELTYEQEDYIIEEGMERKKSIFEEELQQNGEEND